MKRRVMNAAGMVLGLIVVGVVLLLLRPDCLILKHTGFFCAGCGVQHMVWALLRGDLAGAFHENAFIMILLPFALLYVGAELVRYVRGKPPLYRLKGTQLALGLILVVGILFGVLRNLSGFQWLAPAWANP